MEKYPKLLIPTDKEVFLLDGRASEIPKCLIKFNKWEGEPIKNTFGGKPIVCFKNKPMFAELAIMNYFIESGWEARWVEAYGSSNKKPKILSEWKDASFGNQIEDPIVNTNIIKVLEGIAQYNNNSFSGCWDIVGWKEDYILFAESKRNKKDKVRQTQNNWLKAGLKFGLKPDNFLIVQWDMN